MTPLALLCLLLAGMIVAGFWHDCALFARHSIGRWRLAHSFLAAAAAVIVALTACRFAWGGL